ncbi:MAG TPA: sugar transferase [Candidatus Ruania gallistercoris]|uniref:Sugar transferase n=1 Tax=Candidatus Ruania gallistercoris TaxID=2838746 RepID=A0A9D2EB38_9MICO|nr:sugar transferase [Candidatus Ruania gallistercoris]
MTAIVTAVLTAVVDLDLALAGGLAAGIALTLLLGAARSYDLRRTGSGGHEYAAVARAGGVWAMLLIGALYFADVHLASLVLIAAIAGSITAVLLARTLERALVHRRRRRGQWQRRTLLVGDPVHLQALTTQLRDDRQPGLDVVGLCAAGPAPGWTGVPVLGDVTQAAEVVTEHEIDVVVLASSCLDAPDLRRFCWQVEHRGVELLIAPNIEEVATARVAVRPVSGIPMLAVAIGPSRPQRSVKVAMDRMLGGVLLTAALPVLAIAALLVRIGSPGSPFYAQQRAGQDGTSFTMYKLRTMYVDADRRRAELLARSDGNEVMFKMRHDPRITPVGRVLRRFSVDELPQLWNVVRGDMSLVGPRPPLHEEVAGYDADARQRLRVKPGLTGLWQVSGRSDLDWAQTVRLDLNYVDNRSLVMDLGILARTFRAVFGGRGAY